MTLGDRMKKYEYVSRNYLTRRVPVIVRLDGRAFHTFCRSNFGKRYNDKFQSTMAIVACNLQQETHCKFIYGQSDEMSLLLMDWENLTTEPYFDYNVQKICSILAGIASGVFYREAIMDQYKNPLQVFDCRCFNIPKEEVANYFIWRQQDCIRNSIHLMACEYYSHKELHGKDINEQQSMILKRAGRRWSAENNVRKFGYMVEGLSSPAVNFMENREMFERLLK